MRAECAAHASGKSSVWAPLRGQRTRLIGRLAANEHERYDGARIVGEFAFGVTALEDDAFRMGGDRDAFLAGCRRGLDLLRRHRYGLLVQA